jgi:asparagine synthase (glutamine-hydrolysing)
MCGIFGVCGYEGDIAAFRPKAVAMSKKLRSRGPDWSGVWTTKDAILCHERLAIVGVGKYQLSCLSSVSGELESVGREIRVELNFQKSAKTASSSRSLSSLQCWRSSIRASR